LRDISDDMKQAAGDFRRGASAAAARSAGRARDKLRDLEQKLAASGPDERRRALGELQLEARQLADRQRQVASELAKIDPRDRSGDTMRRLAGEEGRLRERAQRLEDRLKSMGATASRGNDGRADSATQAARDLGQERLSDRMRQAEEYLRAEAGSRGDGRGQSAERTPSRQAMLQEDVAKSLDRLADRLAEAGGAGDKDSQRLSEQLARAERMKESLDRLSQALESASPNRAAGERGRTGEGTRGAGGIDLKKLQEESLRQLRDIRTLVDELKREDPSLSRSGAGFTLEGQGMILSAPGTEAFKQDFAKWDALRRQASVALEQAQSSLSKRLQAKASKDRLPAGVDDVAPPAYQGQVDRYFKALAAKRP
jgi:hypothetical protein